MSSVDNRVVKMSFENAEFEKKVGTTLDTLKRLKDSLNFTGAVRGMEEIQNTINQVKFDSLVSGVEALQGRFSVLGEFVHNTFMNMVNAAVDAGRRISDALVISPIKEGFAEYELQMGAIQTILAGAKTNEGLPVTLDLVNQKLDELNTYADKTIYSFSDMTQNIGKFTNAGVGLEDAVAAIQGVSNVAAVSGANAQQASHAMYNFAQALSSGYVKLIDWKSIEIANMATVGFKDTLLQTGLAMGTLVQEGEKYRSTTANAQGSVSDLFDATVGFNDSLQNQWMTTEVLTQALKIYATDVRDMADAEKYAYEAELEGLGYTKEQIAALKELGIKAADAAKDVKTFTQLIDTLKEALGSGWTKSWQYVIGDFEEAKKLWTDINDILSDYINKSADARNAMLKEWSENGGRKAIIDSLRYSFNALLSVMEPIKQAWDRIFPAVKANDLIVYSEALRDFTAGLILTDTQMTQVKSGALMIFTSLKWAVEGVVNVGKTVIDIFSAIGKGISSAVTAVDIAHIGELTSRFKEFSEAIRPTESVLNNLTRFVYGLTSVLKAFGIIAINVGSAIFDSLSKVFTGLSADGEKFMDYLGNIGDKLAEFSAKITDAFKIDNLGGISSIANALGKLFDIIRQAVDIPDLIGNILNYLLGIDFSGILNTINGLAEGASNGVDLIHNAITNFLSSGALSNLVAKISEFASKIDWHAIFNIFSHIESFIATKALMNISKAFKDLPDTLGGLIDKIRDFSNTPVGSVTNLLNSVKDSLEAWQKNLKGFLLLEIAGALVAIAMALKTVSEIDPSRVVSSLELLGGGIAETLILLKALNKMDIKSIPSLWSLSQVIGQLAKILQTIGDIEPERLKPSVIALGAVLGELAIALKIMNGVSIDAKETLASTVTIYVLTKAVESLSKTLEKIGNLNPKQITKGLIGIFILIAELVIAIRALPADKAVSGAGTMIAMALAIRIISNAVEELGNLNPKQIAKGVIGVAAILAALTIAINHFPDSGKLITSAMSMIGIAIAIDMLTGSLERLSAIKATSLVKGLGAIGTILLELTVALNNMPDSGKLISSAISMIGIAIAIGMLTGSLERLSAIKATSLVKGLGAFSIVLLELTVALNNMPDSGKLITSTISMLGIAFAIDMLTGSLERLSAIKATSLVKGLGAFSIVLLELIVALNNMPDAGKLLSSSVAIIAIAFAIGSIVDSLEKIAAIKATSLAKSIVGIAVSLLILSIAAESFSASLIGAAAMIIVAGAIAILAPALVMLSNINIGGLVIALGALAGAMVIFGIASTVLAPTVGVLLAFGAAVALAGVGLFALSAALGSIASIVAQTGNEISSAFSIILQAFIDNIPLVVEMITTLFSSLMASASELIPQFLELVFQAITAFMGKLGEFIPFMTEFGLNLILALLNIVGEHIGEIVEAGITIVVNFIDGIASKLPDVIDSAFNLIISFINGLADAISAHHGDLTSAILNLIQAIVNAILDGIPQTVTAAGQLVTDVIDAIGGYVGDMYSAACNLVQGFIDGLWDGIGGVWDAAVSLANTAWRAMTGTLKEHSPSKLTFGGGVNFALGFINGMKSMVHATEQSSSEVAYGALTAFSETMENIPNVAYSPTISPVIDSSNFNKGFYDGMQSMNNELHSALNIDSISYTSALLDQMSDFTNTNRKLVSSINDMTIDYDRLGASMANALIDSGIYVKMDGGKLMGYIASEVQTARHQFI